MALWTLIGLAKGKATTSWPLHGDVTGQEGLFGMPRYNPDQCDTGCAACAEVCPTEAIRLRPDERGLDIDYGRCVVCQLCTEACPTDAMMKSADWAFGVRHRDDLRWLEHSVGTACARDPQRGVFRRSLHIRHVDGGSCNGCESELQALNNPFYNMHRLGIFFTPSPRFADLLLVTGPVTRAMEAPLRAAYDAMPQPRWVMATGTCAVSGGVAGGGYACNSGLDGILPVDVFLPGCPPNPAAIIEALLMFLGRTPQRVKGGRCGQ